MLRSPVRILLLTVTLMFAIQPLQHVHGVLISYTESVVNTDGNSSGNEQPGRGSSFARALGAPFRAIARLFSHKKKNETKLERITEKDIKKFPSAPVTRTDNATLEKRSSDVSTESNVVSAAQSHLEKGREALQAARINEAIYELSAAVSIDPNLSEARTLLGVAYDRKGLNDLARQSFEVAAHDPSDQGMHFNNLGYLAYKQGRYEEAVKLLKQAAKLAPNDLRIWNNLGLAQSELGKFDDAYKSFAHVAGEYIGRLNVAARLESRGESAKAIKHLRKALELQPQSREVMARLSNLYDRTGQLAEGQKMRELLAQQMTVADAAAQKK
jgi:Flp pilus assembly protein TadD